MVLVRVYGHKTDMLIDRKAGTRNIRVWKINTAIRGAGTRISTYEKGTFETRHPVRIYAYNGLLLGNILYNKTENSVTIVDYEHTAYNYQAFDIANHFAEFVGLDGFDYSLYLDETLQGALFRVYLKLYNGTTMYPKSM